MSTIQFPAGFGYVLLVASSIPFINLYHSSTTSRARKAAGIEYPTTYASDEVAAKDPKAFTFNCAQRAHANFTENLTPFLAGLFVSGLRYPIVAGCLGGCWALGRIVYTVGYSRRGPRGRILGSTIHAICSISLGHIAVYSAVKFIMEN